MLWLCSESFATSIVTDNSPPPDYSNPGGPVRETTIPASKASINAIAGLHALMTLDLLEGIDPGFTSSLLTLAKVDGVFPEAFRPYKFRIARSPECLICGQVHKIRLQGRNSMWHWIKHLRDWAMNDIVTPHRIVSQPQAIYFSCEKSGMVLHNQPIPWNAEAVLVEAILRLRLPHVERPISPCHPGREPVIAESLRKDEASISIGSFSAWPTGNFREGRTLLASSSPGRTGTAGLDPGRLRARSQVQLQTTFVHLGRQSVAAGAFVSTQCKGVHGPAIVRSPPA